MDLKKKAIVRSPLLAAFEVAVWLLAAGSYARQFPPASASDLAGRIAPRPLSVEMLDFSETTGRMSRFEDSALQGGRKIVRLSLERGSVELPTSQIGRVIVQPTERLLIRTDQNVRTLLLGHGAAKQPEPPGWYLPDTQVSGWKPAVAQWPHSRWRYIPQAIWIWAGQPRHHANDETVLFRHEFDIPTTATILSAQLDVSADSFIESFFLNGTSLRLPTQAMLGKVSRWDVTYLLRPGRNVIAARVTNSPGGRRLNYAGFCYRLVCEVLAGSGQREPSPPGVVLFLANGDRLSGNLETIGPQWLLRRDGSALEIDPDWITLALVNYAGPGGENELAPVVHSKRGKSPLFAPWKVFLRSRHVRPAITLAPRPAIAWNRELHPARARQGILLRNGDWIEGRIEGLRNNRVLVKPRYGEAFGIPVDRVFLLQPNRPDPETQFLYRPADFPYVVKVRLANNDRITGALEALTANAITITPHFSGPVRLALNQVLAIDFAMNMTARYRERLIHAWTTPPRLVAAIGESDESLRSGLDKSIVTIQRTLQNLGLELRWLRADQIVEAGRLTPERFPVLLNFDQNERYFYTVSRPGDGFDAIRNYVKAGGTIVHFARGVPFRCAYVADRARWRVQRPERDLNAELMMNIVWSERSRETRPFELPRNSGQHMYFVLDRMSPFSKGLPAMVDLPMIADMRFRPITDDRVTTPAQFFPVYRLVDNTGTHYGVAMAVIRYGWIGDRSHYGIYVSHLLYEASYEGKSMIEYLLPKAVSLALGATEVSVSNLAAEPDSAGNHEALALPDPLDPNLPPRLPIDNP